MTEKEIAKSPEKSQRSDHSDRASHQTAQEAVVGDDKNQSLHHKAKLSDNQHNLSDPALLTPKEGDSIDDYRKRVEAIQNNRFEITGLEEGTNSPQDQNDNMTTAEVKALGGKDAEMMFNAINKMPEGPEKDQAKQAIKTSYTEVLSDTSQTDPNKSKPLLEGHISNTPESDTTEKIGWLVAAQKISQLPLDKQLQVIGAGLSAGITALNHQQRERSIGAVIGTVQGVGEVATNLGKIADFSAYCILGDDRAVAMGAEFGESLGKSIVGGIKLFEGAHKYLNDVGAAGAEGDYSKVFRDVSTLGDNLNKAWSDLPPREQSRILAKLTTDMAADGLMGLGAARNLGKASKFTEILDTIAEDAQMLHKAGKSISNKTINKLQDAIDPVVEKLREHRSKMAEAFDRMDNELFWIRHENGVAYKVNEDGRKAYREWKQRMSSEDSDLNLIGLSYGTADTSAMEEWSDKHNALVSILSLKPAFRDNASQLVVQNNEADTNGFLIADSR